MRKVCLSKVYFCEMYPTFRHSERQQVERSVQKGPKDFIIEIPVESMFVRWSRGPESFETRKEFKGNGFHFSESLSAKWQDLWIIWLSRQAFINTTIFPKITMHTYDHHHPKIYIYGHLSQGGRVQFLAEFDPLHWPCWGHCQTLCEAGVFVFVFVFTPVLLGLLSNSMSSRCICVCVLCLYLRLYLCLCLCLYLNRSCWVHCQTLCQASLEKRESSHH